MVGAPAVRQDRTVIEVGPHRYTESDARRTVAAGPVLVGLLTAGLDDSRLDLDRALAVVQQVADDEAAPLDQRLRTTLDTWRGAAASVRASGALGPPASGTVAHLATSGGGVPKQSSERIEVGWSGVVGDVQADRSNHGRPWQALCLWSTEVIDGFRAHGDPLGPGLAGENITVTGLPWARVRPGSQLRIGTVTCEVSAYAVPCRKNAPWFADRRFDRMHHRHGPVSRVYAWVVEPGTIVVGDAAVLE